MSANDRNEMICRNVSTLNARRRPMLRGAASGVAIIAGMVCAPQAFAQPTNLVSACAGVSLPP